MTVSGVINGGGWCAVVTGVVNGGEHNREISDADM